MTSILSLLHAREISSLDQNWKFFQGEAKGAENTNFDDAAWTTLSVPHDWSILGNFSKDAATKGSGGWLPSGVAWYRKSLELPKPKDGAQAWIEFDGIMQNSDVWLNGKLLGHRPNGYVSFAYNITDQLSPSGKNLLVVRADTSAQPASRWYSGAGIYRHVRLVTTHAVHVEQWGVHVSTENADENSATIKVSSNVTNSATKSGNITIIQTVLSPNKSTLAEVKTTLDLAAGKSEKSQQKLVIPKPPIWSLENTQLCTLVTKISANGNVLDEVHTPFGIRKAEFDSAKGFLLNGKNIKLKGVCLHHDGGAVGAAVPLAVWERRLTELKKIGVNSIRLSHNPFAPEFLDLCDRMGFLVMDEFFDCWTKGKNKADYHLFFKEWHERDLRDGVLRDRNHPSVILYSVGNEIHDTPNAALAKDILKNLVKICHENDPAMPVTQALFRPNVSKDYDNGLADMLDVIGTNYRSQELLDAWKKNPKRKLINTEQVSDRKPWLLLRDNPQLSGTYIWTGIDYLGEAKVYPVNTYNSGLLDRAGFFSPHGYEMQSWWSNVPMVKIGRRIGANEKPPSDPGYENVPWERKQVVFFDWNPDNTNEHTENVEVYSNAETVELFLNDKSYGKQATPKDDSPLSWKIPYQAGTLKAVAKNGDQEVATDVLRTAGTAKKIVLSADKKSLTNQFDDVAHIIVNVTDENGVTIPTASNKISFSINETGKIVGLDNASIVSTEPFTGNEHTVYQGRLLALIRAAGKGKITLTAKADGLESATVEFSGE